MRTSSTIRRRIGGGTFAIPSTPAVRLPRLSCVTLRTAKHLAEYDRSSSRCKLRGPGGTPLEVATERCFVNALLESEDVALELLPGQRLPAFSVLLNTCHKTQTPIVPLQSILPCPRQLILRLSLRRLLLGQSSSLWLAAGYLLAESTTARAINELPCSLCPLVGDFRTMLYAGSCVE